MLNIFSQTVSNDLSSGLAMVIFALIIILILYFVSRRRRNVNKENIPFKEKLYSIYKTKEGYTVINHGLNDEKVRFTSIEEVNDYISKNKIQ